MLDSIGKKKQSRQTINDIRDRFYREYFDILCVNDVYDLLDIYGLYYDKVKNSVEIKPNEDEGVMSKYSREDLIYWVGMTTGLCFGLVIMLLYIVFVL